MSLCFSSWSLPIFRLALTSIAATKFLARSVWTLFAKSIAVLFGGRMKQSGSILPCESPSFPVLPGNTAMHFNKSNTAVSSACWIPVLPNLSRTFFCMNSRALC